ncbi:MAG: MBL fold metallo-hydrolase [Desulfarculaceae bacterium]|nr:MBL fold metallo-hydrolase [Desulfarculaceae bacterium]MCF8074223.1 MBL fold metallo-hydrolase [Desulfarculaceae bacterium]MCF8103018.1 MBL fold metallo-hydrolase [Desulfarculaceae bacterium]
MRLTVLGSGTCELRARRSSPAYLVQAGEANLMLDLGQGAWRRLMECGHDPAAISGVIISHPHLDHMADLLPLLFALNYDPRLQETARMTLLAHPGVGDMLHGLEAVFGSWLQAPEPTLTRRWLEPGQGCELGGVRLSTASARHHAYSLAWRLEADGASLVYLGDSEAGDELAAFAQGADLIICHCAGSDDAPKEGHLFPAGCGRLADRAGAGALLLSHFYRAVDPDEALASARRRFAGPVWAARDAMVLEMDAEGVHQAAP